MCGIAGWYADNAKLGAQRQARLLERLAHRGPDGNGIYKHGAALMAHTRLAIIDPASSQQPMHSEDDQLTLVFNGEIYNYPELRTQLESRDSHFRTRGDSETILQAYALYGLDCVSHLEGMFAFALFDRARNRMLLARDRLGIKPLYFAPCGNGWAFASEMKSLLALLDTKPGVNSDALAVFMQGNFGLGTETLLNGVESLLPGEAAVIESNDSRKTLKRWNYWSVMDIPQQTWDMDSASEHFEHLILQVMDMHLRTDVPYGLFLSGGLDSAILLALISRLRQEPVRTFALAFEEDAGVHELELAPKLAKQFNARHTTFTVKAADMLGRVADSVWASDHPNNDFANLPTALLAEAASREVKVVLTGEGGDEVFAGYDRYGKSTWHYWKKGFQSPGTGGYRTRGRLTDKTMRALFLPGMLASNKDWRARLVKTWRDCPRAWSHLQRMQYLDLHGELHDNLLVKADRMLMSHGVEGRVPFLDHRVVEFGLGLPDEIKRHDGHGKYLLRKWGTPVLGEMVTFAHKRGFKVPIGKALFDKAFLKRLTPALLASDAIRAHFQPESVKTLIEQPKASRHHEQTAWSLLVFALWHRLHLECDSTRPGTGIDPLEILTS